MPLLGSIAGLQEAIEAESFDRLAPFTVCPERICGIEVQPLTPQLALELDAAKSPFMQGEFPESTGAIAAFLWHVSVQRLAAKPWYLTAKKWDRKNYQRFINMLAPMNAFALVKGISDYMREAYADGPSPSSGGSGPPFASWASAVIDSVASRYGWDERTILNLPFKRMWQYWRRWTARETGKRDFINEKSHGVRSAWLEANQPKPEQSSVNTFEI